jgi:hypothetical protein
MENRIDELLKEQCDFFEQCFLEPLVEKEEYEKAVIVRDFLEMLKGGN